MSLAEQIVMVTGAAGAIGPAVSRVLAAEGAHLVLVDRNEDRVQALARDIAEAHAFASEISDEPEAARLVARVLDEVGEIDGLVHLVGGFEPGSTLEASLDVWDRMFAVNLRSALVVIRAVLPTMLDRGRGRIVTVGSQAALEGGPGVAPYAVSKLALLRLTEILSVELRGRGVSVNAIAPSTVDTPANRRSMPEASHEAWVRPEAVARAVVFLLESEAITGDVLKLYGGA